MPHSETIALNVTLTLLFNTQSHPDTDNPYILPVGLRLAAIFWVKQPLINVHIAAESQGALGCA